MDDDDDFRSFAIGISPRLLAAAYLLLGDSGHAEDLVQKTLLKTYLAWDRVRAADDPVAYVRRVLFTTAVRGRRQRRVRELFDLSPDIAFVQPSTAAEDRDEISRILLTLPARQRAVIVLRFYEDLSVDEVARELGCSAGTVKSQTSKALASLRSRLPFNPQESR